MKERFLLCCTSTLDDRFLHPYMKSRERNMRLVVVLAAVLGCLAVAANETKKAPGLIDAAKLIPDLLVDLKYSTKDNFMGKDVYGDLQACFLQKDAAEMLAQAAKMLESMRPDLQLLVYDCLRPVKVQRIMWDQVKGTPQERYVANPNTRTGSIHNYGCAVDLTLADKGGKPLDMGTAFDFFGKKAGPRHEQTFRQKGELTAEQWSNRLLLRTVMVKAGFHTIASEWWHFNCATPYQTRKRYKKVP